MKKVITKILQKSLKELDVKVESAEIEKVIEIPPSQEMGDFAFPCFFLVGKLFGTPHDIALQIREKIENPQ